jgi:menaquinone-9 beta-reductase
MTRPLIVGGAIAGSAAAIMLARGGERPLILERARETGDAICGGFLSWQSLSALEQLGLPAADLRGHSVARMRLFAGPAIAEARLPRAAMGLSRRRLDTLLLATAERAGTGIERGVTAASVARDGVTTRDGARIASDAVFLATGKHGLRDHPRLPPPRSADDPVVGLRLRLPAHPALSSLIDDAVELFLFDRGYAGLVIQEDGSANLCLAVHKSRLSEAGGAPATLIDEWSNANAALGERLAYANTSARIDAIAAVPYGWSSQIRDDGGRGIWRLGDQAAVIPSLAGEGMGIALYSGISAANAYHTAMPADRWQQQMERKLRQPMRMAALAWRIGEDARFNRRAVATLAHIPWLMRGLARLTRVPGD